ncbi:calcium-binding and coiled-coil domain-containing protein 2 [Eurytemora carolleeae]|uniref:calcium-binding and coiled-coil domain-containing protein 2 n=1 Tax=Eurytemora carolleeae TaxID=1294199 RepID=UPI000C756F4E|nr:calcium-binding and coiled-coil domain-containing protein 2 [Eurytemora carolleeae]|eukprot:XP_023343836.1 calcium-binding and coiled-coil domain-containing protein 2-like [Eurytemora affinis]
MGLGMEVKGREGTEGIRWEEISEQAKLIQVWRWLTDSETNLRTVRSKHEKQITELQHEKRELEIRVRAELEEKESILENMKELEEDNRELALNLKEALRADPRAEPRSVSKDPRIDQLIYRLKIVESEHDKAQDLTAQQLLDDQHEKQQQLEDLQKQNDALLHKITDLEEVLISKEELNSNYKIELDKLYQERKDLAKKSVLKEEEQSARLRLVDQFETKVELLTKQNQDLVKLNMKLKYG